MDGTDGSVRVASRSGSAFRSPQNKTAIRRGREQAAAMGIGPGLAVEKIQRHAAQFQFKTAARVAVDLKMHHHRARLLDLPDLSQLHPVAEAGGQFISHSVCAEIAGGHARQHEKN